MRTEIREVMMTTKTTTVKTTTTMTATTETTTTKTRSKKSCFFLFKEDENAKVKQTGKMMSMRITLHVHCRRHSLAGSQELHSQWGESGGIGCGVLDIIMLIIIIIISAIIIIIIISLGVLVVRLVIMIIIMKMNIEQLLSEGIDHHDHDGDDF